MTSHDPLAIEGSDLRLPRPLWKLKEELAELINNEPKRGTQRYNDWASRRVGLQLWIDFAEHKLRRKIMPMKMPNI